MLLDKLAFRFAVAAALLIGCFVGGYLYGSHRRALADAKDYAALQVAQAQAVAKASELARSAQAQADAETLAEQQAAISDASAAVTRRQRDIDAAHAQVSALQDQLAALRKLRPEDARVLNTPIPHEVLNRACIIEDGVPAARCH